MKKEKLKTTVELFVCNYDRKGDEACFEKGAKDLTDKLKKWSKEEHKGDIKIFRTGCLGKCSEGIAMVCYPEKKFILDVKTEDLKEIKKGLEEALEKAKES